MEKIIAHLVDYDGAMKRLGGDRELFRQLIEIFDEDAPVLLHEIRRGVAAGDAQEVVRAAHRLKGLLANFGAEEATECAQRLEHGGASGNLQDVTDSVAILEGELLRLGQALDEYRRSSNAHE